jgi:hypothetical protein
MVLDVFHPMGVVGLGHIIIPRISLEALLLSKEIFSKWVHKHSSEDKLAHHQTHSLPVANSFVLSDVCWLSRV